MKPFKSRKKGNPEAKIQQDIITKLRNLGWFVKVFHASQQNSGIPDVYAAHPTIGQRFIEVKNEGACRFTKAQKQFLPVFREHGGRVWFITSADRVERQLALPPNWSFFERKLARSKVYVRPERQRPRMSENRERQLQNRCRSLLERDGWLVVDVHANAINNGWPDQFIQHPEHGFRWLEYKAEKSFTNKQVVEFPKFFAHRAGIWFITTETDLSLVRGTPNWEYFFKIMGY